MSKIIPYVFEPDKRTWSIPDQLMAQVFVKMHDLGIDRTVFVNGTVINYLQWLLFCQAKGNVVNIVGNEKEVEAVTWLNSFGFNYAFGHFCFFPQTWGKNSVELGKMVLKYWFEDLSTDAWGLDVIMGQVPANNERAIDFTDKLGMSPLGTVPGIRYKDSDEAIGSYFCYIERKDISHG